MSTLSTSCCNCLGHRFTQANKSGQDQSRRVSARSVAGYAHKVFSAFSEAAGRECQTPRCRRPPQKLILEGPLYQCHSFSWCLGWLLLCPSLKQSCTCPAELAINAVMEVISGTREGKSHQRLSYLLERLADPMFSTSYGGGSEPSSLGASSQSWQDEAREVLGGSPSSSSPGEVLCLALYAMLCLQSGYQLLLS